MDFLEHKGFEGWYFKHQKGDDMVAFIPGRAESGAFVQMISSEGARQFAIEKLAVSGDRIKADRCRFSRQGCHIDLPGVKGEIAYGPFTPLRSDIMGPFRFFSMECRHGVLSMGHALRGQICINGQTHHFDGGWGYAEKDSGVSFPRSYQWVQCNDFPTPCSLMAAVARIPFCAGSFIGCICAVLYEGQEYRLATYKGVQVLAQDSKHLCIVQGELLLELDMEPCNGGHPLSAPRQGKMCDTIRETCNAHLRARLWKSGRLVFDLKSAHAVYEFVPPAQQKSDTHRRCGAK